MFQVVGGHSWRSPSFPNPSQKTFFIPVCLGMLFFVGSFVCLVLLLQRGVHSTHLSEPFSPLSPPSEGIN